MDGRERLLLRTRAIQLAVDRPTRLPANIPGGNSAPRNCHEKDRKPMFDREYGTFGLRCFFLNLRARLRNGRSVITVA